MFNLDVQLVHMSVINNGYLAFKTYLVRAVTNLKPHTCTCIFLLTAAPVLCFM